MQLDIVEVPDGLGAQESRAQGEEARPPHFGSRAGAEALVEGDGQQVLRHFGGEGVVARHVREGRAGQEELRDQRHLVRPVPKIQRLGGG